MITFMLIVSVFAFPIGLCIGIWLGFNKGYDMGWKDSIPMGRCGTCCSEERFDI